MTSTSEGRTENRREACFRRNPAILKRRIDDTTHDVYI